MSAVKPSRRTFLKASAFGISTALVGGATGFGAALAMPEASDTPDWGYRNIPPQHGKRVVVTGGNGFPQDGRSGLGYHQALGLASAGADVIIASRNEQRGEEAAQRIAQQVPAAKVRFEVLDLTSLPSIDAFAERLASASGTLDLLINNAGVMARTTREITETGLERTFATNALGPFALSARLLPLLRNSRDARIVWMASMRGHGGSIDFDDLQKERNYDYVKAYDDTKLANLLLASECDRRSRAAGWGITSIAAHPGVARTNIVLDGPGPDTTEGFRFRFIPMMWQDPAVAALPILYAGTSPQAHGGGYYGPQGMGGIFGSPGVTSVPENAQDPAIALALWNTLEQLGQTSFA